VTSSWSFILQLLEYSLPLQQKLAVNSFGWSRPHAVLTTVLLHHWREPIISLLHA